MIIICYRKFYYKLNKIFFLVLEKDLKPTSVFNYSTIEKLMEQGNKNKSIAETKMNATSR